MDSTAISNQSPIWVNAVYRQDKWRNVGQRRTLCWQIIIRLRRKIVIFSD